MTPTTDKAIERLAHAFAVKYGLIAGIGFDDARALDDALGIYLGAALPAIEAEARTAALRAALDGLVAAAADFLADWDGFDDVRPSRTGDALRTALAAAREVTP